MKRLPKSIYCIAMFVKRVWRTDEQYGFISASLAWDLAKILAGYGEGVSNGD